MWQKRRELGGPFPCWAKEWHKTIDSSIHSFSEDQLVAASQPTQSSSVCKTLTLTRITCVTGAALHSKVTLTLCTTWLFSMFYLAPLRIKINSRNLSHGESRVRLLLVATKWERCFLQLGGGGIFLFLQTSSSQMCLALCQEQESGLGLTHEEEHITSSQVVS